MCRDAHRGARTHHIASLAEEAEGMKSAGESAQVVHRQRQCQVANTWEIFAHLKSDPSTYLHAWRQHGARAAPSFCSFLRVETFFPRPLSNGRNGHPTTCLDVLSHHPPTGSIAQDVNPSNSMLVVCWPRSCHCIVVRFLGAGCSVVMQCCSQVHPHKGVC